MNYLERIPGRVYDVAVFVSVIAFILFIAFLSPSAYAAPIAKQQEAGCVQFAKVGMWDVYHCVDANGFEFEANSAGMMIPAEK